MMQRYGARQVVYVCTYVPMFYSANVSRGLVVAAEPRHVIAFAR